MNTPQLTEQERILVYQLVCRVVLADERLDDTEIEHLGELYQRLGLTHVDRRQVHESIDRSQPVEALAGGLSESARSVLKNEMLDAAWADRSIQINEAKIIVRAVLDLLVNDQSE